MQKYTHKIKTCPICDKEFTNGRTKYCSEECAHIAHRIQKDFFDRKKAEEKRKKARRTETSLGLDEKIKEANQRGITYGQLQAEKLREYARIEL